MKSNPYNQELIASGNKSRLLFSLLYMYFQAKESANMCCHTHQSLSLYFE